MKLKSKKEFAIVSLLIMSTYTYAAIDDGDTIRSNNNNNWTYGDNGFTSGFTSPVFFNNATDSYSQAVINYAGTQMFNAFGIAFTDETATSNWWEPPFDNRIAVIEMYAGAVPWVGFAGAYVIDTAGNSTSCMGTSWTGINTTTGDLIGLTTTGNTNGACDGQAVNAGLIIMNTGLYDYYYGTGGTPPDRHKQHLLLHEFGHLSGMGHINPSNNCGSIMLVGIHTIATGTGAISLTCSNGTTDTTPITYGADDREVMQFKGF